MHRLKRLTPLLVTVGLLLIPLLVFLQRQAIFDWWRLLSYSPSPEIVALTDRTQMSDSARQLFYVYHPLLSSKQEFNGYCHTTEHSIVLGCYVAYKGIYIYDVTDERLNGVEEVTAAHEMLHAAYDRLNDDERQRIDVLTDQVYSELRNDRIIKAVESYREQDPLVVPNELHSIIGTEVREIPEELEEYYSQYFDDRLAVVTLSEKYERAFTERREQYNRYDEQRQRVQQQIDENKAKLTSLGVQLNSSRKSLDSLLAANKVQEYNAAVPSFNAIVQDYNATAVTIRSLVGEYNRIVERMNKVAIEESELIEAIDSRPDTIETR